MARSDLSDDLQNPDNYNEALLKRFIDLFKPVRSLSANPAPTARSKARNAVAKEKLTGGLERSALATQCLGHVSTACSTYISRMKPLSGSQSSDKENKPRNSRTGATKSRLASTATRPSKTSKATAIGDSKCVSDKSTFGDVAGKIAFQCIHEIEKECLPWDDIRTKQMLKLQINLATKLLDMKSNVLAYQLLMNIAYKMAMRPQSTAVLASRKSKADSTVSRIELQNPNATQTVIADFYAILQSANPIGRIEDAKLHMQATVLSNIVRCLLEFVSFSNSDHVKMLFLILQKDETLFQTYSKLKSFDAKLGSSQFDYLFRIMYSKIGKLSAQVTTVIILPLAEFYIESASFSSKAFHGLILRPILESDSKSSALSASEMAQYFKCLSPHFTTDCMADLEALGWIDFMMSLARNDESHCVEKLALKHLNQLISFFPDYSSYLSIIRALFCSTIDSTDEKVAETIVVFPEQHSVPARLQRSLYSALKLAKSTFDFDSSTAAIAKRCISTATFAVLSFSPLISRLDADIAAAITKLLIEIQFTSLYYVIAHENELNTDILDHLAILKSFCESFKSESTQELMADSSFKMGVLLLKKSMGRGATHFFEISVSLTREMLKSIKVCDAERLIKATKQFGVFSQAYEQVGDLENAFNLISEALNILQMVGESEDVLSPLIEKFVVKRVKLCNSLGFEYKSVARINENDMPSLTELVLEVELGVLKGFGMTANIKLDSLANAVKFYEKSGNAIAQARALIDSARLLRRQDPSKPNATRLCEDAVVILKRMVLADGNSDNKLIPFELAIAYSELGISRNENGSFDPIPFHFALNILKKELSSLPSLTAPFRKIKNSTSHLSEQDAERVFHFTSNLCEYFQLLNQPMNSLYTLRLLFKLIHMCPSKTTIGELFCVNATF